MVIIPQLYRDWPKSVHQVWWILLLLLLINSAPTFMQTGASTLADLCNLAHEDKEDLFVNFEETSILHNPIHSNLGGDNDCTRNSAAGPSDGFHLVHKKLNAFIHFSLNHWRWRLWFLADMQTPWFLVRDNIISLNRHLGLCFVCLCSQLQARGVFV